MPKAEKWHKQIMWCGGIAFQRGDILPIPASFYPVPPSTINSAPCSLAQTRNETGILTKVRCRPSRQLCSSGVLSCMSGSINQTQVNYSNGPWSVVKQYCFQRHGYQRATDKHSTQKKRPFLNSFAFPGPRAEICPVPPTGLLGLQPHHSQQSISEQLVGQGELGMVQPMPSGCFTPRLLINMRGEDLPKYQNANSELYSGLLLPDLQDQTNRGGYN